MNFIVDLDGTLSCAKQRLFRVFSDLVVESDLSFDQYWALKYSLLSNQEILRRYFNASERFISKFESDWMDRIEHKKYLALDRPIEGVGSFLRTLVADNSVYLCTARQTEESVFYQLELWGFSELFSAVLVTKQTRTKAELISESVVSLGRDDWVIGDTGNDVRIGNELGLNSCAVLTGFMNKQNLLKYQPDRVLKKITDFEH